MEQERQAENDYFEQGNLIFQGIEQGFNACGMSDHGMIQYLIDLWDQLFISYQARMKFLKSIQGKESKQIYQQLESETATLADFKNESLEIYQLLRKKESLFGNMLTQKYHQVEHKSELFSLRAELQRKIEDFQKKSGSATKSFLKKLPTQTPSIILWRGLPYLEILKLEKNDVESRMKDQIREEVEAKRLKRGTTYSTYNRLMV